MRASHTTYTTLVVFCVLFGTITFRSFFSLLASPSSPKPTPPSAPPTKPRFKITDDWSRDYVKGYASDYVTDFVKGFTRKERDEMTKLKDDLERYRAYTTVLRRTIFAHFCRDSSTPILPRGMWCLSSYEVDQHGDRIPSMHIDADEGVARSIHSVIAPQNASVTDLGAGVGQYGRWLAREGWSGRYEAYDGAINVDAFTEGYVQWADLTIPLRGAESDWVMCLEVGEHIPAEFEEVVLDNVANNARCGALVSWGVPNQGGHGHVNNRPNEWVVDRLRRRGFSYREEASHAIRRRAQYDWFKKTTMLFTNDRAYANSTKENETCFDAFERI